MQSESNWLSADWGTTNFRLRLVEADSLRVRQEISGPQGVASVYQSWMQSDETGGTPERRLTFYKHFLLNRIRELEEKSKCRLDNIPVILSGMAGSTIGMTTLPYQQMPCPADGTGLHILQQAPTELFPFSLVLVSGVCNADDVMRGEETMLIGAAALTGNTEGAWYIFPGTHSKHIYVAGNQLSQLRTYMTGELFALLSEKSILADSVGKSGSGAEPAAFAAGLEEGWSGRLAHSLFLVRTGDLLGKTGRYANYRFLSGVLIGHELRGLPQKNSFCLVGDDPLLTAYQTAIRQLLPEAKIEMVAGASALIRGQWQIAAQLFDWKK